MNNKIGVSLKTEDQWEIYVFPIVFSSFQPFLWIQFISITVIIFKYQISNKTRKDK